MLRAASVARARAAAAAAAARGVRGVADRVSGHAGLTRDANPHEVRWFPRVFLFFLGGLFCVFLGGSGAPRPRAPPP